MLFTKKVCLNWYFSMKFFFRKIRMIFDIENSLWKSKIGTCHQMETQNLVISFDYSWFLAKNLAYAECPIMKFHYRHSSSVHRYFLWLYNIYSQIQLSNVCWIYSWNLVAFLQKKTCLYCKLKNNSWYQISDVWIKI